jgi:hypothetical protein
MARLKHLVRHLSARDRVINTCSGISDGKITVWTDSDWAGCKTSQKSTDCVLCMFGGSVFYASRKTQAFVAQSSGEAEMAGIHRGGLVGVFCQNFLHEVGLLGTFPIELRTDSAAGIGMRRRKGQGRVRHLSVNNPLSRSSLAPRWLSWPNGQANKTSLTSEPKSWIQHQSRC